MFTLRAVSKEEETNYCLGTFYTLVHRDWHPETFKEKLGEETVKDESIYAVVYDQHDRSLLLTKDRSYYVMTESGRTYACVSFNSKS